MHVFVKLRPVSVSVAVIVGHEQKGVYHLVLKVVRNFRNSSKSEREKQWLIYFFDYSKHNTDLNITDTL